MIQQHWVTNLVSTSLFQPRSQGGNFDIKFIHQNINKDVMYI